MKIYLQQTCPWMNIELNFEIYYGFSAHKAFCIVTFYNREGLYTKN